MNRKQIYALALSAVLSTGLVACGEREMAKDNSNLDILTTTDTANNGKTLNKGVTQQLDVNGEDFKLIVHYLSKDDVWRINSNKKLSVEIKTKNLPDNLSVYIDNVHMDTSIVSSRAAFDGIKQDTMDDRVHNSLMIGFPISDGNSYYGICSIDGQNDTFIKGYSYGNQYYHSGSITEKRYLESDYLADGVYANEIDVVIDLWICDKKTDRALRHVSVASSLLVEVNDKVTFQKGDEIITYDYDRDGSREEIKRVKKMK